MIEYLNPQGITTWQNSLQVDGQLIHSVNCYNPGMGILAKRPGYGTTIGTVAGSITQLFSFPHQDGTQIQLYAAAGSLLYYSLQGTAPWAIAQGSTGGDAGGTITNGNHVGHAILNNVMIIGDGGTTRHTTNGTQFSNTTNAPVSQYLTQFHQRIYASDGTTSTLTYSSYGSADNWSIVLPADSSSFTIPDEGATGRTYVAGDRLIIDKTRGKLFNWDDTSLIDESSNFGASSPWSVAQIDDNWFYINQVGMFQDTGANRNLLSNNVQNQFYNNQNTGIVAPNLINAVGETYLWDYLVTMGTITDPFIGRQMNNVMLKYDLIKNQFHNWIFNDIPTAMHSYIDIDATRKFIFGNSSGQVFKYDLTKTSDNGVAIPTEAVFLFTYAIQQTTFSPTSASAISGSTYQKKWNLIRLFFNAGDEVNIQFAFSDTLQYQHLRWSDARNTRDQGGANDWWQVSDGVVFMRFPNDPNNSPRSTYLFLRIYDESDSSQWVYRGCQIDAEPQIIK